MRYIIDNEHAGYYNATTGAFVGGVAVVGSEVASIAQMLTNSENPNCWATIGTLTVDSMLYKGIFIYLSAFSMTEPAIKIVSYDGTDFRIYDRNNVERFVSDSLGSAISDASGQQRFCESATTTSLIDANGKARFSADETDAVISCAGATDSYIKITPTAATIVVGGVTKETWS